MQFAPPGYPKDDVLCWERKGLGGFSLTEEVESGKQRCRPTLCILDWEWCRAGRSDRDPGTGVLVDAKASLVDAGFHEPL